MPALAITGIIGSGKSTVLKLLSMALTSAMKEIVVFSADEENRRLLDTDPEVHHEICSRIGKECYLPEGIPDRGRIFEIITSNPTAKRELEEILHPRIESLWKPLATRFSASKDSFLIAEIPLLYEKELESFFDRSILIACSDSVRNERLKKYRSMKPSDALLWKDLQHSLESKLPKADHLLWNDGSEESLKLEIQRLVEILCMT
jgi:dephospho-CoA kinase